MSGDWRGLGLPSSSLVQEPPCRLSSLTTADAVAGDADGDPRGVLVDTADIPGGGRLQLFRHGQDYEILFGEEQLMGSWAYGSEQMLATLALERLDRAERVLIGGLGMGFTLAAARQALPPDAAIVVAELVPKVVAWAHGPLAHLLGDSLRDPRVSVVVRDVHDVVAERCAAFDAILLDVDNGPEGLITLSNERLYCNWGLRDLHAALRPGGVLAVWSSFADQAFADRLRAARYAVDEVRVDACGGEGERPHTIWFATKPA